jgi:hypothetical protein
MMEKKMKEKTLQHRRAVRAMYCKPLGIVLQFRNYRILHIHFQSTLGRLSNVRIF